ncbi:MAG: selenide, water dikinase SelD [Deltaproteobacteria bacterium]|nr:selenide, water dikinase SelD [Deltaproteobacteria bacterium]
MLSGLKLSKSKKLLVGADTSDDAAVYQIIPGLALISTVDIISPVCNDPYLFGQIAAVNALSDVYAMGGSPILALNICAFPVSNIDKKDLSKILEGAASKVEEAGAVIGGGHSIKDQELKFGLSVIGTVHPLQFWRNNTPQVKDALILTKPLGTGVAITAYKKEHISEDKFEPILRSMATLNKYAAASLRDFDVHAVTDVTGFGLAGHGLGLAQSSDLALKIRLNLVPTFEVSIDYMNKGLRIGGTLGNEMSTLEKIKGLENIKNHPKDILFDPQTSGGLLVSLPSKQASEAVEALKKAGYAHTSVIGEVIKSKA